MTTARWLSSVEEVLEVERVADTVRRAVANGELSPDTELTVSEMRERMRASTGSADAALARLLTEGVLLRRGRSAVVPPLDRAELGTVHRLRAALEPRLAVESSALMTRTDISRLDRMKRNVPLAPDLDSQVAAIMAWRGALVSLGANGWELRALRSGWQVLERYVYLALRQATCHAGELPLQRTGEDLMQLYRERSPGGVRRAMSHLVDQQVVWAEEAVERLTLPPSRVLPTTSVLETSRQEIRLTSGR